MKTKLIRLLLATLLTLLATGRTLAADGQTKPLTNQDVIKMLEEKVPESVILAKIQASETKFDTSTDAVIALNKKGVSEKLLNAMLNPCEPVQLPAKESAGSRVPESAGHAVPAIGSLHRVFLVGGSEPTEMKQNKGEFDSFAAPFFAKVFIKFEGREAELRLNNPF